MLQFCYDLKFCCPCYRLRFFICTKITSLLGSFRLQVGSQPIFCTPYQP